MAAVRAGRHAEIAIESRALHAASGPAPDTSTVPVRYVVARVPASATRVMSLNRRALSSPL
ncbi:hypothetical protein CA984_34305 [Streptosporangium minutum]|uniref:Uncharacterized protein n=1 Tax=Streptosporangium minutum TaxID=569862 RepID=A0A243R9I4_9ACTN|nr:hypothetical protein CA984_34305 [Streptosporangium minutum]